MADTGRAAARHLALLLQSKKKFAKAFRQLPFLIPISWQCTNDQPTKGIYQKLAALESDAVPTLSFAPGFPAADFPDCGPSVFAYGKTQADADTAAEAMAKIIISHEDDFDGPIYSPDEGIRHAMELAKTARKPIVIADTQDNPGAGGDSDTTGMLRALVRNKATKAALGVIYDPQSAKAAHAAGVGATVTLALGGKSGISGDAPYQESFIVEKLSDGQFVAPGPYYGGRDMDMGPSAALRIGDVRVVVSSHKAQLADQSMYRYVGIEPTEQSILVNKSSVHFRADFEPIAETLIICAAPGAMPADTAALPWTRLRPGIRIKPNGPPFSSATKSTASKALPTNSPRSAGICTHIPRSASRRFAPPASLPTSWRSGASRFIAASEVPAWSGCSRAMGVAASASGCAPIWMHCRWKRTPI
jgi:microcystin degradation protein MlrC